MTDRSSTAANVAGRVRDEDAFDVAVVADWLRTHADEQDRPALDGEPRVTQFPGGASNLTYELAYPRQRLILRRPPAGAKARGAHDMTREHHVQDALRPVFGLVPRMVALCEDESVIGSPFYVMERVEGTILRRDLPDSYTAEDADALCRNAVDVLCDLHRVDASAVPRLAALDRGDGYVARQVSGWTGRLERAATADLGDWSDITGWLDRQQPADVEHRVIHNDFRFDNLVLDPDDPLHVVGVLDWEMATVGDPLMDLGGTLAYWVQADDDEFMQGFRRQPTHAPGMWTRRQVLDHYAARTGLEITDGSWRFYEVFGLFRLAVIAQQIWYRYFHGQTSNPAYAPFGPAVGYLEGRCRTLIGRGRCRDSRGCSRMVSDG